MPALTHVLKIENQLLECLNKQCLVCAGDL